MDTSETNAAENNEARTPDVCGSSRIIGAKTNQFQSPSLPPPPASDVSPWAQVRVGGVMLQPVDIILLCSYHQGLMHTATCGRFYAKPLCRACSSYTHGRLSSISLGLYRLVLHVFPSPDPLRLETPVVLQVLPYYSILNGPILHD